VTFFTHGHLTTRARLRVRHSRGANGCLPTTDQVGGRTRTRVRIRLDRVLTERTLIENVLIDGRLKMCVPRFLLAEPRWSSTSRELVSPERRRSPRTRTSAIILNEIPITAGSLGW